MESLQQSISPPSEADALPEATVRMVKLLSEDFAEFDRDRDSSVVLKRLVGRLKSIDRVPHSARQAIASVLHEQFTRYAERMEVSFEGRPLAGHILDALMNLGYPWALQVEPEVVSAFDQRLTAARRGSRLGILGSLQGEVGVAVMVAMTLLFLVLGGLDLLPLSFYESVGSVAKAIFGVFGSLFGS